MEKKSNFLNRKTLRKMKRQEMKQKKDFFYKHKNNLEQHAKEVENFTKKKNDKFSNLKFFNNKKGVQREINDKHEEENKFDKEDDELDLSQLGSVNDKGFNSDDEEVDSDIPSDKDSNEDSQDEDNEEEVNDIPVAKKITPRPAQSASADNDLDIEIKNLEKKLGLKDGKKRERFAKRVAEENYDEDLFEFLDNIDKVVKGNPLDNQLDDEEIIESKQNVKTVKESKVKQKLINDQSEKNFELETSLPEKASSLEEIKSQSRLFSNNKMSEEEKLKQAFQKDITSLLNKISEANLILMFPEFISKIDNFENSKVLTKNTRLLIIYEIVSKISIKMTLDQEMTNLPITSCICSYLSVLHYKFGNSFLLYFMKSVYDKIEPIMEENKTDTNNSRKSVLKNFIFLIIHFYIFKNFTSKMYFEIIKIFIDNFNSVFSEILLILLSYIGIEIRKEDPESLKEIISSVNKKYNTIKLSQDSNAGKIKYIVDMIDDIKNNKYMKFNLSEKFNFFKNFVNTNKNSYSEGDYDLSSAKIADKIDLNWNDLQNVDKLKIEDLISSTETNKTEKEIFFDANLLAQDLDSGMFADNKLLEKKMKKLKITTELKKMIFTSVTSSTDCSDAFERLMRLNLKRDQAREIIKIIVLLTTEEKCYNPFYRLLLVKLMSVDKDHKYTFHYTIWDYLKVLESDSFSPKKIHNLAKLCAELLAEEKISLPVFLNYQFEAAGINQKNFLLTCFDKYFEKVINPDKCKLLFAKLVKNDDHVEFAKRLFYFFINDLKNNIDLTIKSKEYLECYTAVTKVLKRIL